MSMGRERASPMIEVAKVGLRYAVCITVPILEEDLRDCGLTLEEYVEEMRDSLELEGIDFVADNKATGTVVEEDSYIIEGVFMEVA